MRVFVSSTPQSLAAHREAASETVRLLGWKQAPLEPMDQRETVDERERWVGESDLVIAIVGWSAGERPEPEQGGDGRRGWIHWELRAARRHAVPLVVLVADDRWPIGERESDADARSALVDLRAELGPVSIPFGPESPPHDAFRTVLRRELSRHRPASWMATSRSIPVGIELRRWPKPELPERPYPVLLPYSHPELMAGRRRDLEDLIGLLRWPSLILGLHAPSGAGKSSLLAAGVVTTLRSAERPVAFERHPLEPGLAGRLLGDLLEARSPADDRDPRGFARRLVEVARVARATPLLVIDQFEEILRLDGDATDELRRRRARATIGPLLAATSQRQPGFSGPPCRWLLAYRREYHGPVSSWLEDVLRDARAEGLETGHDLPHDLAQADRFHAWAMPLLGAPTAGSADPLTEATRVFLDAIRRPLDLLTSHGQAAYPWQFSTNGAERLARAFAEARIERPSAPLAPELQVVLARLLESAPEPLPGETVTIEIPSVPGELIDKALEQHLERSLTSAFPSRVGSNQRTARRDRTRALLALRELADLTGRRDVGLPSTVLATAIGDQGAEVLERLATPSTRLVVPEDGPDGRRYVLSHDRLAELLVDAVENEGRLADLEVDADLLALHRFVLLRSELHRTGEEEASVADVPSASLRRIEANADALLWGEARRRWWRACLEHRRLGRRRARIRWAAIVSAAVLLTALTGGWAQRRATDRALLGQVSDAEPEAAFAAVDRLLARSRAEPAVVLGRIERRERPTDLLDRGLGGVDEPARGPAVLRAVRTLLPLVETDPYDPVLLADLIWALDVSPARSSELRGEALELRDRALAPVRRAVEPPPRPASADPEWREIPGGTFRMGSTPEEGRTDEHMAQERPQHEVRLSPFRLLDREVTNADYRRLVPDHVGEPELPAQVSWHQAYVFAAWWGGRLPTEAEWEYAAIAGCRSDYCDRLGRPAAIDDVAWWFESSLDAGGGEPTIQPVRRLEPNPWGLYDMAGNAREWVADWWGLYPAEPEVDPIGPTNGEFRSNRGYSFAATAPWVHAKARAGSVPNALRGFRIALPASEQATDAD